MKSRIDYTKCSRKRSRDVSLEHTSTNSGLEESWSTLVKMRASQIMGARFASTAFERHARAPRETESYSTCRTAWEEGGPFYSARERSGARAY